MSTPLPVQIIRPYASTATLWARMLGVILGVLARAWLVMLLLPIATPWSLSFVESLAAVLLVGCAHPIQTPLDWWSKAGRK